MNRTYLVVVAACAIAAVGACRPAAVSAGPNRASTECRGTRYVEINNQSSSAVDVYTRMESPILVGPAPVGKSRIPITGTAAAAIGGVYYAEFSHTTPSTACTGACSKLNGSRPRNITFKVGCDSAE